MRWVMILILPSLPSAAQEGKERQRLEDAYRSRRELNEALLAVRAVGHGEMMKRVRSHLEGVKLRAAEEKFIADTRPFGSRVGSVKHPTSDTRAGDGCETGCAGGDFKWGKP